MLNLFSFIPFIFGGSSVGLTCVVPLRCQLNDLGHIYLIPIVNNFILYEYIIHNLTVDIYLFNFERIVLFYPKKQ